MTLFKAQAKTGHWYELLYHRMVEDLENFIRISTTFIVYSKLIILHCSLSRLHAKRLQGQDGIILGWLKQFKTESIKG